MRLGGLVVICGLVWAGTASAQGTFDADASDALYEGAVVRLRIDYANGPPLLQTVNVALRNYVELVAIERLGAVVFDATDPANPPTGCTVTGGQIDCSTPVCQAGDCVVDALPTVAAGEQNVAITFPGGAFDWDEVIVYVRIGDPPCAGAITADFLDENDLPVHASISEPALQAACITNTPLASVTASTTLDIPRRQTPSPVTFTLQGTAGGPVDINALITDPDVFAATFRCAPPGGVLGSCTDPAFTTYATLTALQDFPAQLSVVALDVADPARGDGQIEVTLPGLAAPATIDLVMENPAVTFTVGSVGGASTITGGTFLDLQVIDALNDRGSSPADHGHEPHLAVWSIDGNPAGVTVTPLAPVGPDQEARGARVQVTVGDLDQIITVRASPIEGGTDALFPVTLLPGPVIIPPAVCRIAVEGETAPAGPVSLGLGESRTVSIVREDDGTPITVEPDWQIDFEDLLQRDEGAPGDGQAVVTARAQGSARLTAVFDPVDPPCEPLDVPRDFAVATDVDLWLERPKTAAAPGKLTDLVMHLAQSGTAPVELTASFDPMLGPVGALPRQLSTVGSLQALPAENTKAATVRRAQAVVPQGQELVAAWTATARPAFGCGKARLSVTATRAGATLDTADVEVDVACEPELTESTLVGRVFLDNDGDGEQDEGERGLPGALVATSVGIWATTDENGSYHLVRLPPGRVAVKVDPNSLPLGTQPVGLGRRELTLTPGMFTRASFAVREPDLSMPAFAFVPEGSGLLVREGRIFYAASFSVPAGATLVDAQGAAAEATPGGVKLVLPAQDAGHRLLVLRFPDGRTWLYVFSLHVYTQGQSRMVLPWGPRFVGAASLPADDRPLPPEDLAMTVEPAPGATLSLSTRGGDDAARCVAGEDGQGVATACRLRAPSAKTLILEVDAAPDEAGDDPPKLSFELPLVREGSAHFLVALGGVQAGYEWRDEDSPLGVEGNGAFFYKGSFHGLRLTAGADLRSQELLYNKDGERRPPSGTLSTLFGHDPRRVFLDLDPEAYYPTYGDGSTMVDEREAGGRLYARLEGEGGYLKWGGVNTAIDDVELGQYVRSLYGMGGQLKLDDGDLGVRGVVFGARPDSVAARDELWVTGGSLYFLAARDVVIGSLRIKLEILDEVSGLPVRVVALVEGQDYEADYAGGRISLDPALPGRTVFGSLTGRQGGGAKARLIVDYEYWAGRDLLQDWSVGGRLVGRYGPLSLGATAVGELQGGVEGAGGVDARYRLLGATARLHLDEALDVRLEVAQSEGQSHLAQRSFDGGLTHEPLPVPSDEAGHNAFALHVRSELGRFTGEAYGRVIQAGFADSRTSPGRKIEQEGVKLSFDAADRSDLWLQVDHRVTREITTLREVRDVARVGGSQTQGPVRLALEGRYEREPKLEANQALAGGEVGYHLTGEWEVSLRRRQRLFGTKVEEMGAGKVAGETALGVAVREPSFTAAAEAGMNDHGVPFGRLQAGLPLEDGNEVYAAYLVSPEETVGSSGDDDEGPRGSQLVVGGRQGLDDGTKLWAQQQVQVDGSERRLVRQVGLERPVSRRLSLALAYERGALAPEDEVVLVRDAGSLSATWAGERVLLHAGGDGRYEVRDEVRGAQLGAQGRVELRVADGLTLAAGWRGGTTYDLPEGEPARTGRRVWEGSVGVALRPLDSELVQAFARYVLEHERLPATVAGTQATSQVSHVGALMILVAALPRLDVGPKLYYRHTTLEAGDATAVDRAALGALRGDWHLDESWDASLEGRVCAAPRTQAEPRLGALVEASALALPWLRLGAGYNLSTISTAGVQCDEPGARGVFVRAEAVY